MTPTLELVERIDLRLLANLSQNFRSPYEAIFELVDNGVASRLPEEPVTVTVSGSGSTGATLTVVTRGGLGMGLRELREFFHWGKAPESVGLHQFGQGGKAAIGYLGTGVRIVANRHDEHEEFVIEDHDWLSRPEGQAKRFVPERRAPHIPGIGVVQVEIFNLKKRVSFKKLEKELAWRYGPALRDGVLKLKVHRRWLRHVELSAQERRACSHPVLVPALDDPATVMPVTLTGWVGIAPPKFDERGGVRCSAHGRVVERNDYFGHKDMTFKASLNSLIGEADLSFVPVLLNKNSFDQASPQWEAAAKVMHDVMAPYVARLLRRKESNEPTDEERERAMEAKDIAHRALDKIAADADRRGIGGQLKGRKPPEPRLDADIERVLTRQIEERAEPEPRTPPPSTAVGRLSRKGSSLDWDVRALDPKIRSASEHIDGRVEIVINNEFPAYKQRNGDVLYMLETGLLEELRPSGDDEDKTIDEYVEQVTDALYVAMAEIGASGRVSR